MRAMTVIVMLDSRQVLLQRLRRGPGAQSNPAEPVGHAQARRSLVPFPTFSVGSRLCLRNDPFPGAPIRCDAARKILVALHSGFVVELKPAYHNVHRTPTPGRIAKP